MPLPLSREQLDVSGCGTPNCGHDHTVLYLHGACHPSAGTRVSYDKRTGILSIECRTCKKMVVNIKVASQ